MNNKSAFSLLADAALVLLFAGLTAAVIGIRFLNSANTPTGGDTASHVLYAWQYSQSLLFSGNILPWMPEVFAGFPFLSYYFPLPFIVIATLTKCIGFAPAFKWGAFAAAMLLPGLVHVVGRRWFALPWPAAILGALGAFAFLLHEQNSIWGGNLLSILSGEFAYSYGLLFALLACFAWARAGDVKGGWVIAALLEAATGFSHGFTLLVVGFSTLLLLTERSNAVPAPHPHPNPPPEGEGTSFRLASPYLRKGRFLLSFLPFQGGGQEGDGVGTSLRRTLRMLLRGHILAFCLLGGWLWPMLEMHGFTIPNDASFPMSNWSDIFPLALRPVFAAGLAVLPLCLLDKELRNSITPLQARCMRYLAGAAALSCLGFLAGDQIGLANIRFFPMVWLFSAILCGWLVGFVVSDLAGFSNTTQKVTSLPHPHPNPPPEGEGTSKDTLSVKWKRILTIFLPFQGGGQEGDGAERGNRVPTFVQIALTLALTLGMCGWLAQTVRSVPDWALWNHAGLESKPQWHNLTKLFPAMKGSLWSPRIAFEHDPDNNDIGSTRTLEALSMFIGGRPVLEGLYMESALIGPAVYQLQSEISARPSSPLVRFPSGSLDPAFAAEHMRFLHADTLLLRSAAAKKGVEESGLFQKTAESPPFAVYRLKEFSSHLAEVVTQPIAVRPLKGWMYDAFGWFRTRSKFRSSLPVYGAGAGLSAAPATTAVREIRLDRHYLHFETDAIGKPHLIKMAWHPRWKLRSAGQLYLAGPGFMLVVPQERDIILEFGHTTIGYLGMAATLVSIVVILFLLIRKKKPTDVPHPHPNLPLEGEGTKAFPPPLQGICANLSKNALAFPPPLQGEGRGGDGVKGGGIKRQIPLLLCWSAIIIACIWFATQSPEKVYMLGHKAMQGGHYDEAAARFERAFERRRQPAKKEEALFWLAKTKEQAGHKEEALRRYLQLADNYHGFWVAESLYTCVLLGRDLGQGARVDSCAARLKEEYPNSSWTGKLGEIK